MTERSQSHARCVQTFLDDRAAADAATTATLVGILAAALTGASLTASGARTLFALGRRREVLVVSTAAPAWTSNWCGCP